MATCYDCIHCGACSDAGDKGFSSLKEDVSKCKHFKNKADYVEVVRCEKCIHSEDYNGRILCNKNAHIFDKNDFCSYGTPKERGVDNGN